ncbi:hypothetical protein BZL29_3221 [Mycobacterium kansasii]|uniref:Uncharacterized protein n=1 Tax=Mycobacterium kansasii TaxID=1768 RepID=A0A1V3XEE6_MYCKA|nr:hypothetical protein BZL29_3221 [Mycobacterium kansasii]
MGNNRFSTKPADVDVVWRLGRLGEPVLARRGRCRHQWPPRRCARRGKVEELLATMAGERDGIPEGHGVLTP